jgi:hypothetical protein
MSTSSVTLHYDKSLNELASILSDDYYDYLEQICNDAGAQAIGILSEQLPYGGAYYVNHCTSFLEEVTAFIRERKEVYLPYLSELSDKNSTGHNCAICSGKCDMQHTLRLFELTTSLKEMHEIADNNRADLAELCSVTAFNKKIKSLSNEIRHIDKTLNELLYLEENSLIPKIKEAQTNINVHS